MNGPEKILIVDDSEDIRLSLSEIVASMKYKALVAGDGVTALKKFKVHSPALVLLDIRMPGMDGMEVLREIKRLNKDANIVILTAYGGIKSSVEAIKSGAFDYVTKPFDYEELKIIIGKAMQAQALTREVRALRKKLSENTAIERFRSECPKIKQAMNMIKTVAPTNMTVVIQGESGTGKGLIAQIIHELSPRQKNSFVVVDCGTLPENLIESELFGYEKGAFTGAFGRKDGKFEIANGGTLFLDEITNLPHTFQSKLLRVIQDRNIQHLGSTKESQVDVRIIVATNKNLSEEVKNGRFREDLYHRINEFDIVLPPLRERKEDIPLLAEYFLEEANLELNRDIRGLTGNAMKSLLDHYWPGNVRELRNSIRRAALLTAADLIEEVDIHYAAPHIVGAKHSTLDENTPLRDIARTAVEKVERDAIKRALARTGNNKAKAAKLLKVDRMTLYTKMKQLGIECKENSTNL